MHFILNNVIFLKVTAFQLRIRVDAVTVIMPSEEGVAVSVTQSVPPEDGGAVTQSVPPEDGGAVTQSVASEDGRPVKQ